MTAAIEYMQALCWAYAAFALFVAITRARE